MDKKTINLDYLNRLTEGDSDKIKMYINMFLKSAQEQLELIKHNLGEQNWENIKISAHTLRPQLTYMGIDHLKKTIHDIEKFSDEQIHLDRLPALIGKLDVELTEAFRLLQAEIDKL